MNRPSASADLLVSMQVQRLLINLQLIDFKVRVLNYRAENHFISGETTSHSLCC